MDFKSIAAKKVAGVPVLYLGAAAVILLALYAWKMKSSTPTSEEPVAEEETDTTTTDPDYSGLATTGTVTVVQQAAEETEAVKETNDDWLRSAVTYLMAEKGATAGDAQTAITNYLEGNDMTYEQGQLKDAAVAKLGLPPERIAVLGNVGSKADPPAQRQFTNFPGKHTVKGKNDHTPWQISGIYYGNPNWQNANLIAAANPSAGSPTTVYAVGTVLTIPAYTPPSYVTVNSSTRSYSAMAKKNGVTVAYLKNLNPNTAEPFLVGAKIRVK
jgi:nucleoid-associated protein YgaU